MPLKDKNKKFFLKNGEKVLFTTILAPKFTNFNSSSFKDLQ